MMKASSGKRDVAAHHIYQVLQRLAFLLMVDGYCKYPVCDLPGLQAVCASWIRTHTPHFNPMAACEILDYRDAIDSVWMNAPIFVIRVGVDRRVAWSRMEAHLASGRNIEVAQWVGVQDPVVDKFDCC